jgi:hypothetical protein
MRQYVTSTLERAHRDLDTITKKLASATTKGSRLGIEREINGIRVNIRTAIMHLDDEVEPFVFFPIDTSIGMYDTNPYLDKIEAQKRCDELNRQDGVSSNWRVQAVAVKKEWRLGE